MHGRTRLCLLAVELVMLAPGLLRGQSVRVDQNSGLPDPTPDRTGDLALPLAPASQPPSLQPARPVPHLPVVPPGVFGLPQLARAAGMIFSARVSAIARRPATGGQAIETVAITFHVEHAIRGTMPGEALTIRQWIGLWSSGQRYQIGEHTLLFLYPPSRLGLTSCVGGPMGRFGVDAQGRVLLSAQQLSAFRQDPVLGGKSRVRFSDFALAVEQASEEE